MRVLFTTLSGAGSLHPHIPLARALEAAGHEVAFAASKSFCRTIHALGFLSFPAGYDRPPDQRETLVATLRAQFGDKPFSPLNDMFAGFLAPRMVPDLLTVARAWRPDVMIRDPLEFGGCIAAEVLGIPHATNGPFFALWQGTYTGLPGEIAKPSLDGLRNGFGLPPDPTLTMLHRYLYIAPHPPSLPNPELSVPPTLHYLRTIGFNQSGAESLPVWIAELPRMPTVHASLGTVFHRTPGVLAAIIEGLRDQAINLIVAVGRDQDPALFAPHPPNIRIEQYIPHTLLLPHCDVIITHCGFGSTMACIEHGLPMVGIPLAGDQHGNAARCVALGAARLVSPDNRTPEAIRDATMEVLGWPRYRDSALRLKHEYNSLPTIERAVELLQRLTSTRAPVLREGAERALTE